MPVAMTCQHCGGQKMVPPSIAKKAKFCSAACKYESYQQHGWPHENHSFKPCQTCGKDVKVTPSDGEQKRFCSQKCMMVWRGPVLREKRYEPHKRETRKCKWCGTEFVTLSCRLKDGRGEYCSQSCVARSVIAGFSSTRTSMAEIAFGALLREHGIHFEEQARFGVWSVDYWFPEKRLAVEFDGDYWHSLPRVKKNDATKDKHFAALGCRVLRIPEGLAKKSPDRAIALVRDALAA